MFLSGTLVYAALIIFVVCYLSVSEMKPVSNSMEQVFT
jgi:hypothetical protein